jgi:iron complex outermembrane receptor protein
LETDVHHQKKILALAVMAACSGYAATGVAQVTGNNRDIEELLVFGTQGARESTTGSRLDLTLLETPATVDVIDGDAIRARIDTSVLDAVTRSAGFTNESNPGNGNSSIAARGFDGQNSVTKLYDGTQYFTAASTITFPFDTWGVERVEVLKGPSSVLYGEGGIGGAINVIPRRPQRERSGDVRLIAGEDGTAFVGVDYTAGFGDSGAFRVDYSNTQSDGWVEPNGDSEAEMLSFAVQWDIGDDLVLSARLDSGEQDQMRYFGIPNANGAFVREYVGLNFNVSDSIVHYEDDSVRLKADWQASDTFALEAELFQLTADRFWKNAEAYFEDGTGLVERWDPLMIGHDMEHTGARANFVFSPSGGGVRASVGLELNDISFERPTNFFTPANPNGITFDEFDTVNPRAFQPGVLANLTTAPFLPDNSSAVGQWAVFGEAQFNPSDRFSIVAALRMDDYDTQIVRLGRAGIDQQVDATTGRVGMVFDLSDDSALYAQYGTGAQHPSSSVVTGSLANREADMIESEQIEVGIKHQITDTGLSFNLALFNIVKNNLIYDDPRSANPADVLVIPEQTSQGLEVGLTYRASTSFQVYGNAALLDAETEAGERPPTYVPEQTLNVGLVFGIGDNVRILADARHVGDRFGDVPIPSYTVVDASVRVDVNDSIGLTVKADNLFDELYATSNYYEETWLVGRPRTLSLAFDYRF